MKNLHFSLDGLISKFKKDKSLNKPVFGLDIGEASIKIARIERGPHGLELKDLLVEELPFSENSERHDKTGGIEENLKTVIKKANLSGKVVSSLPGRGIKIEFLRLPPTPAAEIKAAVDLEAKNNLSFNPEEMVLDYLAFEEEGAEEKGLDVIVVVAPKAMVSEHTALLKKTGLEPLAIEAPALTLASLFKKSLRTENEIIGVLEAGAGISTLSIIRTGRLCFTRSFTVSGNTVTRAIRHNCEVSYDKAEELKKKYGLSRLPLEISTVKDTEEVNVIETVRPLMERLVNDINRSLHYFFYQISKTEVHKLNKLVLCGGGANLKNFPEYLTAQLDTPIEPARPLEGIWFDENKFDAAYLKELAPSLSLVIGLALREV